LKTDVVREAEVLARRLTWLSSLAFDYSRGGANMETGLMQRVLTELVRFEIAASDHARAIAPERTREEAQMAAQRELVLQDTLREALLLRNREVARAPVQAAAARLGVNINENEENWMALAYEATRVLLDLSVERSQRDQGVFSDRSRFFEAAMKTDVAPSMPAYRAEPAAIAVQAARVAHVVAEPATATTSAPVSAPLTAFDPIQPSPSKATKKASIKLSEAYEKYSEARLAGKEGKRPEELAVKAKGESWERNSFSNLKANAKLMIDVIGDKQLCDLTKADFIEAFSIIQRVPANHGKSSKEMRTIREIVEATDFEEQKNKALVHAQLKKAGASQGNIEVAEHQESIARLRVNTVYRHMQDAQRVVRYMEALGYLSENFMENAMCSKGELERLEILQEDNSRKIWGDELPKLFRTPLFQGQIADIGDPMFWAVIIAILHGLREEEVLQLRLDDILTENGIVYFDIKVGAPWQRLKSKAATRRLPFHISLIALGFLDLVAVRWREGEDPLQAITNRNDRTCSPFVFIR
jgi:integrase